MARVAFIGLGNMGGGMAANLAKAGHDVRAFDLVEEALKRARERGCLPAGSAAEAVAEAREAVASVGGMGLIVAPGCVLMAGTPDATVAAVVTALGGPLKPIPGLNPAA